MGIRFGIPKDKLGEVLLATTKEVGIVREPEYYDPFVGLKVKSGAPANTYIIEIDGTADDARRVMDKIDPNHEGPKGFGWRR